MKRILSILLVVVIALSLSGCGKKSDSIDLTSEPEVVFAEFSWPDTDIAKLMPVPKSTVGNIEWSHDNGFVIYVAETSSSDFAEYSQTCQDSGFVVNARSGDDFLIADNTDGYHVHLMLQENDVMFVRIDAPNEENETLSEIPSIGSEETQELQDVLEVPSVTEGPVGETAQETESPKEDMPTADTKSLYYSSNTFEQAKTGNVGVFAYVRKGQSYDQYWIVDFDEGCAYYFAYGNGDGVCDRVQIDEGDLNSLITVTYHDGDSSWQYGLCFKRVRQPDCLIQSELDGTQYEFVATNLKEALEIRDGLEIVDY